MREKLSFSVDNIDILDDVSNSQFATVKIDAFASGNNRHSLYVSEDTLRKTAKTILQKPLVWEYNKTMNDAGTHSDLEVPCGFVPADSPIEFREMPDKRIMMSVVGKVWKRYSGKILQIFERTDRPKSVSVEMEVLDQAENKEVGLTELLNFCYLCITILGDTVVSAIPLARAELIDFAVKEKEEYDEAVMQEFSKYDGIDFTIPAEVKSNCAKAIELAKEYGGTSVSLASARYIVKNSVATPEKVRTIYKYLESHKDKQNKTPDGAYISYMCYGGDLGLSWSKELIEKMDELDNKKKAYFGDINPKKEETIVEDEKEDVKMEAEVEMAAETPAEEAKEDPAEEKAETKEEEKEEHKEEKMSLDSYLDVPAMLAILDEETEGYQELVDAHKGGVELNYAKLAYAMYTKCCKMGEMMTKMTADTDVYMQENMSLKAFKKDVEDRQFMFEVEQTMAEVSETMPKKEFEDAREDAKNFSIDTVDAWKNKVKAIAFSFAKEHKTKPTGFALPFSGEQKKESRTLWG